MNPRLLAAGSTPPPETPHVFQEMKKQYGPDTVALVSWLLEAANHSGAILTTSIKVNGNETRDGITFLVITVDTGLILNERNVDQPSRSLTVWERIVAKAFARMDTLQVPADGVMVDFLCHHCKSFPETDNLADHVDEPGLIEEAKFYVIGDHLRAFMDEKISSQELLGHTQVLVGDQPIVLISSKDAQKL